MRKNVDFTKGNILLLLIQFAIPVILGELFQNLYNTVDALIVGNFMDEVALAGVSICTPISNLLIAFFNGLAAGVVVVISHAFGEKNIDKLETSQRVVYSFSLVLGFVLALVSILLAPQLVRIAGAGEEIFTPALTYLRIYLAGLMFTVIYNVSSGILRGIGDSRTPFYVLLIACGINVVLDYLFVAVLHMGVAGAASATIFSQATSVVLTFRRISKLSNNFGVSFSEIRDNGPIIRKLIKIGLPSGVQGSIISLSNLFVWRYINSFSPAAVAGVGVGQRLDKFVSLPCKSTGVTMTAFVSQNVGAGNHERSKKGSLYCFLLSLGVTMGLGIIVYVNAVRCVGMFSDDPEVVRTGVDMMRTVVGLYFLVCMRESIQGILRGYGYSRSTMLLSISGMVIVRQIYLAVAMSRNYVIENIYYCYPVAWSATVVFLGVFFIVLLKKKKIYTELKKNEV